MFSIYADDNLNKEFEGITGQFKRTEQQEQKIEAFQREIQDLFPSGRVSGTCAANLWPLGFVRERDDAQGNDSWLQVDIIISKVDDVKVTVLSCFRNTRTGKDVFLLRPARYVDIHNMKHLTLGFPVVGIKVPLVTARRLHSGEIPIPVERLTEMIKEADWRFKPDSVEKTGELSSRGFYRYRAPLVVPWEDTKGKGRGK